MKHLAFAFLALSIGARASLAALTVTHVSLPSESMQLYVDGQLTTQTGTERTLSRDTSAFESGRLYHQDFATSIELDGVLYEKTVGVDYYSGDVIRVVFTLVQDCNGVMTLEGKGTAVRGPDNSQGPEQGAQQGAPTQQSPGQGVQQGAPEQSPGQGVQQGAPEQSPGQQPAQQGGNGVRSLATYPYPGGYYPGYRYYPGYNPGYYYNGYYPYRGYYNGGYYYYYSPYPNNGGYPYYPGNPYYPGGYPYGGGRR